MHKKYHWYSNIFLMPRIENALIKIFVFLLLLQIAYLLYVINSLSYMNNYYYILGDSNKYFSLNSNKKSGDINHITKNSLIKNYIKNFEENTKNNFIKNLSSDQLYNIYNHKNKDKNKIKILNANYDNLKNIANVNIQQDFYNQNNIIHTSKNHMVHIKYIFKRNQNKFNMQIIEYKKQ